MLHCLTWRRGGVLSMRTAAGLRGRAWGAGARRRAERGALAGAGPRRRPAMARLVVLLLLLLTLCAPAARGLYFHIGETEKRCFIEEIPDETMVIGQEGWGWRGHPSPRGTPRTAQPRGGGRAGRGAGRGVTALSTRRQLPHPDVG